MLFRGLISKLKNFEVRITLLMYLVAGLFALYVILDLYRPRKHGIPWQPEGDAEMQGTVISVRYLDVFGASQAEVGTAGSMMLVVGTNQINLGVDSWIVRHQGARYFCWEGADRCYPLKK